MKKDTFAHNLLFWFQVKLLAQAQKISWPQNYKVGTTITPLSPINTESFSHCYSQIMTIAGEWEVGACVRNIC
jgi:hypothetical protein